MLKDVFEELLVPFSDPPHIASLWQELEEAYGDPGRFYHTLVHLAHLYEALLQRKEEIEKWQAVLLALFYHDVIYDPLRVDNEAQSAALAKQRLEAAGVPEEVISHTGAIILATQGHSFSEDPDTNLFTDADLSILGASPEQYAHYSEAIRKEYSAYSDAAYKEGRKKVLRYFLDLPHIFKTTSFQSLYEAPARRNLIWELQLLGS